ncbi:MAG: metallophosphoesterase family protein [Gemmataceae bacterium]
MSDTHDEKDRTKQAIRLLADAGADALVHCGDLNSPPIVEALAKLPAWFVFGNHDADAVPSLMKAASDSGATCLGWGGVFEFAGIRFGVAHGHITSDVRRVIAKQPAILFSGHAHFSSDRNVDGIRRINPGALHRAEVFTVALLDVLNGSLAILPVE